MPLGKKQKQKQKNKYGVERLIAPGLRGGHGGRTPGAAPGTRWATPRGSTRRDRPRDLRGPPAPDSPLLSSENGLWIWYSKERGAEGEPKSKGGRANGPGRVVLVQNKRLPRSRRATPASALTDHGCPADSGEEVEWRRVR